VQNVLCCLNDGDQPSGRRRRIFDRVEDDQEAMMKAFVIAAETVNDETMFSEYRKAVPATVEAFGGKFIVRGGNLKLLEGQWPHPRLVIIEFPSREAAEGWYASPDYQKIIGLRHNSSVGNLVIVEA
jgi:uncharacterized protein (DUF1330 family)